MWKSLGLIIVGALFGIALLLVLQESPVEPASGTSQSIASDTIPKLSAADVETARDSNFADIGGIRDVLALPTEFSRREALYVLAGRSNADRLQELIGEAERISDRTVRDNTLTVLFRRLTELDPRTALTLARVDPYKKDDSFERVIWRTWARDDLDEAIFAVKTETRRTSQDDAAQSLYAAYGYMGSETTERIARELGIEQNRQTRLRFLRTLLDDSPRRVIEFIGEEPSELRRREYINWFAYALDTHDLAMVRSFADIFVSASDRALYSGIVEDRFARLNPVETLHRALAANDIGPNSDFHSALQELASRDVASAKNFYGQIDVPQAKMMAAFVIANEIATSDPAAALDWVRSLDGVRKQDVEVALLGRIAELNPEFALEAAASLPNAQRVSSISNVLSTVARNDPILAVDLLASLSEDANKSRIQGKVGQAWLMEDPAAAIEWLGTLDRSEASKIAESAVGRLARSDPETSHQLLALLDEPQRIRSARDLVEKFASAGDISRARALIDEYRGQKGFENIETNFIGGLARHDSQAATQLALQLQDDKERSEALSGIVTTIVRDDPVQAASLMQNVTDPASRKKALQTIAGQWYRSDPDAAVRWVSSLPAGEERDYANLMMVMGFKDIGTRELTVIDSIANPKSRTNAMSLAIYRLARTDQAAALRMLDGMDIPEDQKARQREKIENANVAR